MKKVKLDKFFCLILSIAILVRFYAFINVSVIQRDSPLYLYQAMVVSNGDFKLLEACDHSPRIKKINLFSLSIVPFYYLTKDFEIAGKLVSFISSCLSIVFLYLILRNFFSNSILYLTLLVYALNPLLVKESAEIMRESFFTLMILVGLWCFLNGLKASLKVRFLWFFSSNIFWILSSWIRVEGIFFILFTFFYLLVDILFAKDKKRSFFTWITFSFFPILGSFILISYISFYKGFFLTELYSKVIKIHINPFTQPLTKVLENLKYSDIPSPTPYFWDMVKQNLWLIALGTTLFYKFIPALHFSNVIFLLASIGDIKMYIKSNILLRYLGTLSVTYIFMLWYFTFSKWYMEKRYMLPLIFCLAPFIGIGIKNIKYVLERGIQKKFKNCVKLSTLGIVIYILGFSLFEIIKPVRAELKSLKDIAYNISRTLTYEDLIRCSETGCTNLIFSGDGRIIFYVSNLTGIPLCPGSNKYSYIHLGKLSEQDIINHIISKNYKVVIFEKRVFKEKTEPLREKLEKMGIITYVY